LAASIYVRAIAEGAMAMSDLKVSDENKSTVNEDEPRHWPWVVQQLECFKKIKSIQTGKPTQTGPRELIPEFVLCDILSRHYEVKPGELTQQHFHDAMADLIHHYGYAEVVPEDAQRANQTMDLAELSSAARDRVRAIELQSAANLQKELEQKWRYLQDQESGQYRVGADFFYEPVRAYTEAVISITSAEYFNSITGVDFVSVLKAKVISETLKSVAEVWKVAVEESLRATKFRFKIIRGRSSWNKESIQETDFSERLRASLVPTVNEWEMRSLSRGLEPLSQVTGLKAAAQDDMENTAYTPQKYPGWRYHRSGKSIVINDAESEAALGEGWSDSPGTFRLPTGSDPLRCFDTWDLESLNSEARGRIRQGLIEAHADVVESGADQDDRVRQAIMPKVFDLFARGFSAVGVLTEAILKESIPIMVCDAAVSGGWMTGALERNRLCMREYGHYWVPDRVPKTLEEWFEAKIWRWRGKLEAKSYSGEGDPSGTPVVEESGRLEPRTKDSLGRSNRADAKSGSQLQPTKRPRERKLDPAVQRLKRQVRELRAAGLSHQEICERLGSGDRPPRAAWKDLPWPKAYREHPAAVTKWLSEACS
jgi:hypothetical protein